LQTCVTYRHIILGKLNIVAAQSQVGAEMLQEVALKAMIATM